MTYTSKSEGTKTPRGEAALDSRRPARVSTLARQHASGQMRRLLQQTLGNQGVLRRMESGLRINDVNDPAEKEADRVAAAVMAAPSAAANPITAAKSPAAAVQRKCASRAEEDDLHLQRKESSPTPIQSPPPIVGQVLNSSGQPLESGARKFMEARFGSQFEAVRIHSDTRAAESARLINATAYTVGNDLVFSSGNYSPHSAPGRRILAHELAHVIQQRRGGAAAASADSGGRLEHAAGEAARGVMQGESPVRVAGTSPVSIARLPGDTLPVSPFSQDKDVSEITPDARQQLIRLINKRLGDLDKQSSQPKPELPVLGVAIESLEAERARLFDWKKKLEAGSGILVVPGIARSSPPGPLASQSSSAASGPPPTATQGATQRGTHETPAKKNPLAFSDSADDAKNLFENYVGGGQSTSGNTSRAHTTPAGPGVPKGVPHTFEETLAAANVEPHTKQSGEPFKKLEPFSPLSKEAVAAATKEFYRKPGEVTLPDGQVVEIPPRPSGEIALDLGSGDDVYVPANATGVRADVVRKLSDELKSIERGPSSGEVANDIKKAREAISLGDLERAVQLTKEARSAQLTIPGGVAAMSIGDRLAESIKRAILKFPGTAGQQLLELLTPEAIATMAVFAAIYIIAHVALVGFAADIVAAGLLLITLKMAGDEVAAIVQEIADFASIASSAKTESDLDNAADHLASAISTLGVEVVVAILLHKAGKAAKPYLKPPRSANAVASVVTGEGKPVRVPLDIWRGGSTAPPARTPPSCWLARWASPARPAPYSWRRPAAAPRPKRCWRPCAGRPWRQKARRGRAVPTWGSCRSRGRGRPAFLRTRRAEQNPCGGWASGWTGRGYCWWPGSRPCRAPADDGYIKRLVHARTKVSMVVL